MSLLNRGSIKHAVVAPALFSSFGLLFMEKYGLENLNSKPGFFRKNCPTVYFGCYNQSDIDNILLNKSDFKIVVYGGTDATRKNILIQTKNIKNLYHVAISDYISRDLEEAGIKHKIIPITPINYSKFNLKPYPLGKSVYIYNCTEKKAHIYGKELYEKVIKRLDYIDFKICNHNTYTRKELIDVYKDCFIGLRLINHDGLPNTVVELGLMGRRTVYNGNLPSSVGYKNVDDICKIIEDEYLNVGNINFDIAKDTLNFLENSRNWLKRKYWNNFN